MNPQTLLRKSRRGAMAVARDAARRSPAYRVLLAEHGVPADALRDDANLDALPVLHKDNTFGRFTLAELAGPLQVRELADVLTSSGRGGTTFGLRLTHRREHDRAWFDIDLGLQDAFDIDGQPTLIVNCLPMGVVFPSRAATVANVSVREDMACAVLRAAGGSFAQTIVCTDPLFVNRLLDHAAAAGVDWRALNASMILGEEMLVESQREHIATRLGITLDPPGPRLVASSFGVGELGLNLLFETRETIALRRGLRREPALAAQLSGGRPASLSLPSIFCFNPLRCHVQTLEPDGEGFGQLCLTMLDRRATPPLPRYATGDSARLIPADLSSRLCAAAGVAPPWLPMLAVRGRAADRPAGMPAVEDVKEALYADPALLRTLTGGFRLRRRADGAVELLLQAKLPLAPDEPLLRGFRQRLSIDAICPEVRVAINEEFTDRPLLDYERKFSYLGR
jgi:phenylacetate-CoA ligase